MSLDKKIIALVNEYAKVKINFIIIKLNKLFLNNTLALSHIVKNNINLSIDSSFFKEKCS